MTMRATASVRLLAGDKEPVRVASTANLALSGLLTVDGVVTESGNRVLAKDQTDTTTNGIYIASEGVWQRAPDFNSSRLMRGGMKVTAFAGDDNAGSVFMLDVDAPDIGTDAITFSLYLNTAMADNINDAMDTLVAESEAIIALGLSAGKATQAEAEAGTSNVPWMTPLRTQQAIGANTIRAYPTRTAAAAATIPSGATFVFVMSYAAAGDAPMAVYGKLGSAPSPSKAWHFQSADGAWWQLKPNVSNEVWGEQLGMVGDWTLGTNGTNNDTPLQDLLECAEALSCTARIGAGRFRYTAVIRFNYDGLRLYGDGSWNTWLIPAASGARIAGPSSGKVEECELFDFSMVSDATNGPSISLDLTRFTSSRARVTVQNKKANAILVYMQGNGLGTGPYYNDFEFVLAGNTDQTQIGIQMDSSGVGGADGANDNTIRVKRSVLLGIMFDIAAGNGNKFPESSAESVGLSYIRLNFRTADDTGTVTGGSENTLVDSGQSWTSNEWVGAAVKNNITSEVRLIASNNATTLTVADSWGTQPSVGNDYSIYLGKAIGNMFGPIRGEGLDSSNPNYVTAHPGADLNVVTPNYLTSLGTGQHTYDESGSPNNHWYNGGTQTFRFQVAAPGAGANLDLISKNVAAGGLYLPSYAFRSMMMRSTTSSHTALLTATVFAGLSTIMAINLPNGAATGLVFPGPTQRGIRNGASSPIFLNFTSGAGAFTGDVEIVLQVDLA